MAFDSGLLSTGVIFFALVDTAEKLAGGFGAIEDQHAFSLLNTEAILDQPGIHFTDLVPFPVTTEGKLPTRCRSFLQRPNTRQTLPQPMEQLPVSLPTFNRSCARRPGRVSASSDDSVRHRPSGWRRRIRENQKMRLIPAENNCTKTQYIFNQHS
jgi:hypothetical protein